MSAPSNRVITCADGAVFIPTGNRCVGSVKSVRSHDVRQEPALGEFPVFVEQGGKFRMFTYNRKITNIAIMDEREITDDRAKYAALRERAAGGELP